ncbi:hypothetical protein ANN_08243, partial [Periplaneta americana]
THLCICFAGPYGTNHGVEIHEDVVSYANKKLDEFRKISPALDEYEFCEPKFVKGNCLCLNTDVHQYDRVYCGAACPENHENYMKNLIKVGGVLVMPLNDQLLQIVRTSETTWDTKSVLPVSFATLLLPENTDEKEQIKLPESEPLSLQDACRSSIRTILRRNVELEHPDLKTRRRRHPKKKSVKKRSLRRLVIPIFEESDNDEFGLAGGEEEDRGRDLGRAGVIYDVQRQRAGQITAVIELARSLASHRCPPRMQHQQQQHQSQERYDNSAQEREDEGMEEAVDEIQDQQSEKRAAEPREAETAPVNNALTPEELQEEASVSSTAIAEQRKKIPKREKFDSGIGDEIENGKGLSSDSDRDEDGGAFMDVDSDSDFSDPLPSVGKRSHRSEGGEKASCQGDNGPANSSDTSRRSFAERRAIARNVAREAVIWKRLAFAADEESDKSEEETQEYPAMEVHESPVVETDSYSTYMRSKIQALPLPPSLKAYINLYRDF